MDDVTDLFLKVNVSPFFGLSLWFPPPLFSPAVGNKYPLSGLVLSRNFFSNNGRSGTLNFLASLDDVYLFPC